MNTTIDWDYNQPAQSEARLRQLLVQTDPSSDLSYYLQVLTQIARAQGLQRDFTAAHTTLDEVEKQLSPQLSVATIRYYLERGRVYNSSGQPEKSLPYFQQALQLAEAHGESFYAVDAAHMLAIVAVTPQEQLAWNNRALALADAASDERARNWRGSLYNNIGWAYHDQGDYQRALSMFQQALQFREQQGKASEIRIARWCVGRALRSLGQYQEALALQQALQREWEQSGEGEDAYVVEEMAECLLALDRAQESRPYFAQAYTLLSQDIWLVEQEPERLQRLKNLGQS